MPAGTAGRASAMPAKGATLKVHAGGPQGITDTQANHLNPDLLAFVRARLRR